MRVNYFFLLFVSVYILCMVDLLYSIRFVCVATAVVVFFSNFVVVAFFESSLVAPQITNSTELYKKINNNIIWYWRGQQHHIIHTAQKYEPHIVWAIWTLTHTVTCISTHSTQSPLIPSLYCIVVHVLCTHESSASASVCMCVYSV